MKHIKHFTNFLNENVKDNLEKEFKKLNNQYIKLDKKLDSASKYDNTEDISVNSIKYNNV
jgi:hypothetical protein